MSHIILRQTQNGVSQKVMRNRAQDQGDTPRDWPFVGSTPRYVRPGGVAGNVVDRGIGLRPG